MLLVYVSIACGSLFLLIVSAVFGGDHDFGEHEVHFEHGYDGDGDGDHEHEGAGGPSPFSLRVISVFGTVFGAVGAICTHLGLGIGWSTLAGLASGLILAALAFQLYKYMFSQQSDSTVSANNAIGGLAEVHTPIPADGVGEVSFVTKGQRTYMPARSEDGTPISAGRTVAVVANPSGTLVVKIKQLQ
jgi:membrane protein implicated in regulation of membrane protease activity